MRDYHVNFWSGERSQVIGCDIVAADDTALLEELASAGRYALDLRQRAVPAASGMLRARPRPGELRWMAMAPTGPLSNEAKARRGSASSPFPSRSPRPMPI